MSNRQYLIDAAIKHQVFLQRYSGSEYKQMAFFIAKVLKEAKSILGQTTDIASKKRFESIIRELTTVTEAIYKDMAKGVNSNMAELATYEMGFTQRLLQQAVEFPAPDNKGQLPVNFNIPTVEQLRAAAFTTILDSNPSYKGTKGLTVGDALKEFGANKAGDIAQTVRVGFALGKTTSQIAEDIEKVVTQVHTRQAQTLARTVTNHVAAQSRNEFYSSNSDILEKTYTIVATLDDRTSLTCAALDGRVFSEEDFEAPPYHWNCRTTYIREVKEQYRVDLKGTNRPSKGSDGVETVSAQTTYGSWIKNQSNEFQNEVLGTQRADLLRAGMPVDKFVDKNYQSINIDELRTKDNQHIFDKAGI